MKKIGIYFGSSTGTCEDIANKIAEKLGVASDDVHNVSEFDEATAKGYDVLLLGSSTWGDGDLQDDWFDAAETIKGMDLSGKTVALFGCGDSADYPDTFCDSLKHLYDAVKETGATILPGVSTDGYAVTDSAAVEDGKFLGLALDEVNEPDQDEERIDAWVEAVKKAAE